LTVPAADAVVHPRLPGGSYPCGDLCGAAVAFKLAWQVCKFFGDGKRASPHLRTFLVDSLGLVALATIADMVPLSDENRVMVRHGLAGIEARPSAGIGALMEVIGSGAKKRLTTGLVGFGLAPRINAAGRMERAMMAVEMLTTDNVTRARMLAAELDRCNTIRQEVERKILSEAQEMLKLEGGVGDRGAIILARKGWHAGVIGIVAGRLVDMYHRPAIVISLGDEVSQGSARSIPGFDLYEALKECSEGLLAYGGHAAAAGLKLAEDQFAAFARRFEEFCGRAISAAERQRALIIDDQVLFGQLTLGTVAEIENLEPHGIGNPRPLLLAADVVVVDQPRPVGEQKNHLQLRLRQGDVERRAIAWNMAEKGQSLTPGARCSVVFHPSINEWKERREVQLEVRDFALETADR
jgi:single-stranded-DNA-specific exonuclease